MRSIALLIALSTALAACSGGSNKRAASATATSAASSSPAAATPRPRTAQPAVDAILTQRPTTPAASPSLAGATTQAATPTTAFDPGHFTLSLQQVATGLQNPVFAGNAGDGSGRLFVVEKRGTIRIIANGQLQQQPFLDVSSRVLSTGSEQGLLGLAFHPQFKQNGRFFVYYTAAPGGEDTLAGFRLSSDPNRADPNSGSVLFAIPDPAPNHNGGMLAFGLDGYLYVGIGDGGGENDQFHNGQNRNALLAKLLRLDVDHGTPYGIPADNPFVGQSGVRPEIWAWGLRNPWRFSFDRASGDLYIADVGQNRYEEIDVQPAGDRGENYGWSRMEGMHCFPSGDSCDRTGLTLPVAEYDHAQGCSITGGYVYRGRQAPLLTGAYLYGDYCSGRIWSLDRRPDGSWRQTELLQTKLAISSFGEDEAGELYVCDLNGALYRLVATPK